MGVYCSYSAINALVIEGRDMSPVGKHYRATLKPATNSDSNKESDYRGRYCRHNLPIKHDDDLIRKAASYMSRPDRDSSRMGTIA